jgi:hypothetical protein
LIASVPLALPVPFLKFFERGLFPGKHELLADRDAVIILKVPHGLLMCHSPRLPTTPWNINLRNALAKPVAHNLSHFRQCHPAGISEKADIIYPYQLTE